ncbi:MAG TPA: hypothetical protein H9767_03315 [Candidatus Nosocomiicoccus stercorigallinarum]|nr:hypothetical protein [Candidatus Nosocomiicoccus stercorigallinarum]
MNKKEMMKAAHKIAKQLVKHTENYGIALSMAMKHVWNIAKIGVRQINDMGVQSAVANLTKQSQPKVSRNVDGVPEWIIRKNLNENQAYAVLNENNKTFVVRETEKAKLFKFDTEYGYIEMWSPKSVLVA